MGDSMLDVLKKNLATLDSSVHWLERSHKKCIGIGVKDTYSEDEYDVYETLTARYARTVDLLVNRVLRSVDAADDLKDLFGTVLSLVPDVLAIANNVKRYCERF